jgi:hypothetical protein
VTIDRNGGGGTVMAPARGIGYAFAAFAGYIGWDDHPLAVGVVFPVADRDDRRAPGRRSHLPVQVQCQWGVLAGNYLPDTARAGGSSSSAASPVLPERIGDGLNPLTMR